VRISKEISSFVSGKDEAYAWEKPKISDALNESQKQILQQRGVLTPEELHRLASKTRSGMGGDGGQAECHSELTDQEDEARRLQAEVLEEGPGATRASGDITPSRS
jgi:phosphomethylpyrimidine synthase